jgi:hypothetical protein
MNGKPGKPSGHFCEFCNRGFCLGGFEEEHKNLSSFLGKIVVDPTLNEALVVAGRAAKRLCVKNPFGRMSAERLNTELTELSVQTTSQDKLIAPEEEFVELSVWEAENVDPETKKPRDPNKNGT